VHQRGNCIAVSWSAKAGDHLIQHSLVSERPEHSIDDDDRYSLFGILPIELARHRRSPAVTDEHRALHALSAHPRLNRPREMIHRIKRAGRAPGILTLCAFPFALRVVWLVAL